MVATPSLGPNMFNMVPVQGGLDLQFAGSVISAAVSNNQVAALVAGQAVKLDTTVVNGVPAVIALAADTDSPIGFVVRNLKDANFPADARIELALGGTIMWMTAGAAITRGAKLQTVIASNKVITNAGTNPVVGWALDAASGNGVIFRAFILTPSFQLGQVIADITGLQTALNARVQVADVTVTQAQLNAGKTLIAGVTAQAIRVLRVVQRVTGNFATGTAAVVESDNGTPVVVLSEAQASLATGAVLLDSNSGATLGAGYGVPLGTGDGLQAIKSGSDFTGGTSIRYIVEYTQG